MAQRLLIVDSDRRFIQDHQAALESTFEADFMTTTEGALARLENGQYAAVLLCVEVSENKGYSLCSAIRKAPATQYLKVALISGKATEEEYARHQSLKGRADLYLHKPIPSNSLVAALSPFVPMKMEDPDNPLDDLGGSEVVEEWLDSLKSELDLELPPSPKLPQPDAVFSLPLPPLVTPSQLTQMLPAIPKDAGRVELLEARVQDLEAKLVAQAEELDRNVQDLADLQRSHDSATRNLTDLEQWQLETEQAHQAVATLEARVQELEGSLAQGQAHAAALEDQMSGAQGEQARLTQALEDQVSAAQAEQARLTQALEDQVSAAQAEQARLSQALDDHARDAQAEQERLNQALEAARIQVDEQARLSMDSMESNLLLQAQMEEARDNAAQHLQTEKDLAEARDCQGQLEARVLEQEDEHRAFQERLEHKDQELRDLETKCGECHLNRDRLQEAFTALEQQVATLEAQHERQQLELLAGIDERDGQLGRLNATLDAQQERLLALEQVKDDLEARTHGEADRMRAIHELLADLEGKAQQALDLAKPLSE